MRCRNVIFMFMFIFIFITLRIWDLVEEVVEGQTAKNVSYHQHAVNSEIILTEMSKLSTIEIVNENRAVPIAFMDLDQFLGNMWKGLGNIDSTTYKGKYLKCIISFVYM